jgi:hypothetical protein
LFLPFFLKPFPPLPSHPNSQTKPKEIQVHISFPFGKTLKLHSSCGELIDVSKFVGNNTAYVIVV